MSALRLTRSKPNLPAFPHEQIRGIMQMMNNNPTNLIVSTTTHNGFTKMELLIPIALLGLWIVLQIWVLPKLGVQT